MSYKMFVLAETHEGHLRSPALMFLLLLPLLVWLTMTTAITVNKSVKMRRRFDMTLT